MKIIGKDFISICMILQIYTIMKFLQINIVAAFRGMHVSPAKHSYARLPRKCDYRTDTHTHTDRRTERRRTKWSLCAAMLRRRHKKVFNSTNGQTERWISDKEVTTHYLISSIKVFNTKGGHQCLTQLESCKQELSVPGHWVGNELIIVTHNWSLHRSAILNI